jgi:hypothetical protein
MNKKKVDKFLADLAKVTRKHGIKIGGCGCCGSPFLMDLGDAETDFVYKTDIETRKNELRWADPNEPEEDWH